jgi:hypothetical protein
VSQPVDIKIEAVVSRPVRNLVWDEVAGEWVALNVKDATETTLGADAVKLIHDPALDDGAALVTPLGSLEKPLAQNDGEFGELFTNDVNLQEVLGTQSLLSLGRMMVESGYKEQIVTGVLRTAVAQTEFLFSCEGFNSLSVQLLPAQASAWTGTVTFEVSMDMVTWYPIIFTPNVIAVPVATTTASGIYRFNIAGFKRFRARTSTVGTLNAYVLATLSTAPGVSPLVNPVTGSLLQSLSQRATTYELNTYDTMVAANVAPNIALIKDALQPAFNWDSDSPYNIGETVMWRDQLYRCILTTVGVSPAPYPNNATYWAVDHQQAKSLVSKDRPSAPRLRVDVEDLAYSRRLAEDTLTTLQAIATFLMETQGMAEIR